MTADEVRMLDNKFAILFIRGERPIMDYKYDILKHPNIVESADGKGEVYHHGKTNYSIATMTIDYDIDKYEFNDNEQIEVDYEILSNDEVEEYLREKEKKNEKKENK